MPLDEVWRHPAHWPRIVAFLEHSPDRAERRLATRIAKRLPGEVIIIEPYGKRVLVPMTRQQLILLLDVEGREHASRIRICPACGQEIEPSDDEEGEEAPMT